MMQCKNIPCKLHNPKGNYFTRQNEFKITKAREFGAKRKRKLGSENIFRYNSSQLPKPNRATSIPYALLPKDHLMTV
jgi:hypothetical protein